MGAFKALAKYNYIESIDAGIQFAMTQGGHASESRTGVIMEDIVKFGTAARSAVPKLKELIVLFNNEAKNNIFPAEPNQRRVASVEAAIKSIEAATTQPELRSIKK
jgi:hypothetical protein